MKQYKTVNNLVGWITFLIAATVYCMTIEPTASFWDCPEFITTGYKLEVGHPPGAPFFMLVANLFSQFASDASTVAKMVNYMSALMSGACILFLFWSITHLVRKLVVTDENNITRGQMVTIMGSGLVGALAYTFSDTFWFSAVEGEVYAFSSLFTAVVFWLILKWEDVANEPHSDRWLILIAYLTGLSIGVHLLNLLCLPAIVLVYYYKKVPNANARGSLLALLASGILVAAVLYGIVPGIVKVGGWFELLFVNTLGMSFNTGVIVYIILLAACLIWGIYESYTERNKARMALSFILTIAMLGIPFYGHGTSSVVIGVIVIAALWLYLRPKTQAAVKEKFRVSARTLNTSLLCTMMIVIGYSSYALIVIRSTANEVVYHIRFNAFQPGLCRLQTGRLNPESQVLGLDKAIVALGKLILQHFRVLGPDAVKFIALGRDVDAVRIAVPAGGQVEEGKLKADGAVEVVKEVAPALKDGRFILVLRKLVVNVLVLDRLGVKSICDTADAVWEHPLIRDAVLRRNLLFIGLVRPGDGGFDLLSLGAGQFSLFR